MNISCLEELQMKLDLCLSRNERLSILKTVGKKVKSDKWFVVTDDGQCHLFDGDGMLDVISKVSKLYESYVRKDITRICIPDSVTSIRAYAFANCTALTSVTIPESVTSIGDYAFRDCDGLTSVTIPDSVTSIGEESFYGCSKLANVTIGNNVTNIGYAAFAYCPRLMNMIIPDNVTSIGDRMFSNCRSLTSVIIGNHVTSIGAYTFSSCSSLTKITFKGKTLEQVKAMNSYPWGIKDTSIIHVE